ncbi:Xaa-Pro peptidase family protein [Paenibacillus thiaminolyticus]|uniref:M24 family metallopeptidase n=1 Tax=Paenibacillus thiaminolyticus TaxID=49283 RepID=UPI0035A6AE7E
MEGVLKRESEGRIARLQAAMQERTIDGCLITQNVGLYYFTGSMQTGYLFVPKQGEPVYFVKRSLERARHEAEVAVEPLGSFRSFGTLLQERFPAAFASGRPVIATEYDVLPVQVFERLRSVMPETAWTDGSAMLRGLRMVKSPWEIDRIRTAARAAHHALEQAAAYVRPGMMELELIAHIEHVFRMQGHVGFIRMRGYNQEIITGMVASGEAGAEPTYFDGPAGGRGLTPASPQGSSRKVIAQNEPILVDIGCCIDGYVIDQTRTLVIGKLDEDLERAYESSEAILQAAEANLKPGTVCETLYSDALKLAEQYGLSDHFMGFGSDQVSFLGHGIGMEMDEWPVLAWHPATRGRACNDRWGESG